MIRKVRNWFRVVAPQEWPWLLLAFCWLIAWGLNGKARNKMHLENWRIEEWRQFVIPFISTDIVIVGFFPAFYAWMRLAVHPLKSVKSLEILRQTPWTASRPLPWGRLHLQIQDVVILATLAGLLWLLLLGIPHTAPREIYWAAVIVPFFVLRGLGLCWFSSKSHSRIWSWCILFTLPVLFYSLCGTVRTELLIASVVALVFFEELQVSHSLRNLSNDLCTTALTAEIFEGTSGPSALADHRDSQSASRGLSKLGPFWERLLPNEKFASVSLRFGTLLAAWVAWVTWWGAWAIRGQWPNDPVNEMLPVSALGIGAGLALIRMAVYAPSGFDPLSRLALRTWIVPREDRILVAPLLVIVVGVGVAVAATSVDWTAPEFFAMTAFALVAITLLVGPNLKEHKLTTSVDIRPSKLQRRSAQESRSQ